MVGLPSQFSKPNDIIIATDPGTHRCFSKWGRLTPQLLELAKTRSLHVSDLVLKPIIGDEDRPDCGRYPTSQLYYEEDEVLTGHATSRKMQKIKVFDPVRLVSNWKLGYGSEHDGVSQGIRRRLDEQAKRLGKDSRREFARDWARHYLLGKLLDNIAKQCGDDFDRTRVMIGVCMPPGWIGDHEEMLDDLCPPEYHSTQMFAISETEATFRKWASENDTTSMIGRPIVLINFGGGTIDVSSFIKDSEDDDYKLLHPDRSSHTGSETISEAFEQAVLLKFPEIMEDKALIAYRFRKEFDDDCKRVFGNKKDRSEMFHRRLSDIADKMTSNDKRDIKIVFRYEDLEGLFQNTLKSALDLLQEHINAGLKPHDHGLVILTGGGSLNPYLHSKIQNFVERKGLEFRALIETTQKEDLVEGAVDSLLDPARLTRISTQSRGIVLYVDERELSEKMLEKFQFADRIKMGGYYHLLLVRWFIKVGEDPHDCARTWNKSQQEPSEIFFPKGLSLRFQQHIAVTEQHPGDTIYSPISKDGHVITPNNEKVRCRYEEIRWDLERQRISSEYLSRTARIDRGVRVPQLKLQFRLLIKNNEFETKYGLKAVGESNRKVKKAKDNPVWQRSTRLDRISFNVSEYLKKAYEILPNQSGLVANLGTNDETLDSEDKWDRDMAERERLYKELWSELQGKQESRAIARDEAVRNHQPRALRSFDEQKSQKRQQGHSSYRDPSPYQVSGSSTPRTDITDTSASSFPSSSDSELETFARSRSSQNPRSPNEQHTLQMGKGKERMVDSNDWEGESRNRGPILRNHHNIYPMARHGGFQPINKPQKSIHWTDSGSTPGGNFEAANSAVPGKKRRMNK